MQIWMNLVMVLQIVAAMVMIGLVLVQHGKGADMGASFGSGASGSLFGATGSANFLSRSTAVCAAVFFICTLTLAFFANAGGGARTRSAEESVLDHGVAASAPAGTASAAGLPAIPAASGAAHALPAAASAAPGSIPTK